MGILREIQYYMCLCRIDKHINELNNKHRPLIQKIYADYKPHALEKGIQTEAELIKFEKIMGI